MHELIKTRWIIIASLIIFSANTLYSQTNFIYGRQISSDKNDDAHNPVTDQFGNVYIAGETEGVLSDRNFGKSDGFVSKFDSVGNLVWSKQFGSVEEDKIRRIAIDAMGNLYATGYTKGVIGEKNFGNEDILVVKFNSDGKIIWQKQYGTDSTDVANNLFIDNQGNIFIAGTTKGSMDRKSFGDCDCFLLKLDANGNFCWSKQFGTPENDQCKGIMGDNASNIYVCGFTVGDLAAKNKGKWDAFVGEFTDKGEQIKLFQFGTDEFDVATSILIDTEKNIYVGGSTLGNLAGTQQGAGDAFLLKLNENLDILWKQQFGTKNGDWINGLALNEKISENIVVGCCMNAPSCQASIRMYKKDGSLVSANNFIAIGKNGGTCGQGVCIDDKGNIYQTGHTGGNLFKNMNKIQGNDIFLIKLCMDESQAIH